MKKTDDIVSIFLKHKGNVSDKWEQYTSIYHRELASLVARGKGLRLLEIGVQNGGSLQIWRDYLPSGSKVVGVDINPKILDLNLGKGIKLYVFDATDKEKFEANLQTENFDIIVDDGSHISSDIISSFEFLIERLSPGGVFIIEDAHCSYYREYGGGLRSQDSVIEYFKSLVDALNVDHFEESDRIKHESCFDERVRNFGYMVDSISFYDSVIVIRKNTNPRSRPYGRVITGTISPIFDSEEFLRVAPLDQLRSLLLSNSAAGRLSSGLLALFGNLMESVTAERDRFTEQLASLTTELGSVRAQLKHASSDRDRISHQCQLLTNRVNELEEALSSERTASKDLRASHDKADQLIRQLEKQIDDTNKKLDTSNQKIIDLRHEKEMLLTSNMWLATKPIRNITDFLKRIISAIRT